MKIEAKKIKYLVLAAMLGAITLLHTLMGRQGSGHHEGGDLLINILHITLAHLYLVPIIFGAFWFGIKGGIWVSIISTALFVPHLVSWMDPQWALYNFVEIFLFLLIGGTTGILSEMERHQRLRYEQALVHLDESHRKLREQTEVLFRTEEQLRRADRLSALGELSAGMAHEIRNPLGSIKGAAEILRDDVRPGDPREEFVNILVRETDRLNAILQEFLSFARPKPPELSATDLNDVVESVLALTAQSARKAGVSVVRRLDPHLGRHDLDGELLKQAVLNLVLNAIQAMPGGGTLTTETAMHHGLLEVRIADTGPGIAPEDRARLFDPFYTTKQDGTGLGLAITFRIVQNHRGTIDVESEQGKGSVFIVRLPVT